MHDVTQLVEMMKKNRIVSLKLPDGTAIELDREAFAEAGPLPKAETYEGPDLNQMGSRGMTRGQQIELFGQAFEQDFAKGH